MRIPAKSIRLKNERTVILRSATEADAENMLRHLRTSHTESYRNVNNPGKYWDQVSVADEAKILADFESSKSKFMLAAFSDDKIVGGLGVVGAQAEFTKHCATLGMSIQQSFCNSGLGTEMMRYALQMAKEIGFHRIDLSVRTYNPAGIALYEKVGFERIGLLKHAALIDGEYVDEYSYQMILE